MRFLTSEGRTDEVSKILKEMMKHAGKQNTVAYNALMNGFCKEKDFEIHLDFWMKWGIMSY